MPIYKGLTKIESIYKGTQKIDKVYKGVILVYSSAIWLNWFQEYLYNTLIPTIIDTHEVKDKAKISKVYGNSVVENQLVQNGNFTNTSNWDIFGGTLSVANNIGTLTINSPASANRFEQVINNIISGHKYLVVFKAQANKNTTGQLLLEGNTIQSPISFTTTKTEYKYLYTAQASGNLKLRIYINSNSDLVANDTFSLSEVELFDLTQMFPFDTPTSLTDVRVQALLNGGYITNNTGEIKNVDISEFSSKPYNLLNLDRTKGTLSGYGKTTPRDFDYSKYYVGMSRDGYYDETNITNYEVSNGVVKLQTRQSGYGIVFPIKVLPNISYTLSATTISDTSGYNTGLGVGYYDENGLNIGYTQVENTQTNKSVSFTTPSNCVEITVVLYTNQNINLTTYSSICFHRTGTRTGYAPHTQPQTLPFIYQGDGVGTSHDTFEITSSEYVFTKNNAFADLHTLSFGGVGNNVYYATLSTAKADTGQGNMPKILCDKYEVISAISGSAWQSETRDKVISLGYDTARVYVRDTSVSQASEIIGNLLYELATPQVIRIPKKHLGIVDLGSLSWSSKPNGRIGTGEYFKTIIKHWANYGSAPTMMCCSKYINISPLNMEGNSPTNLSLSMSGNGYEVLVYDSELIGLTNAQIQAKLSGQYLFYETESEVADIETQIQVEAGGTITSDSNVLPHVDFRVKCK